MEFRVLGPIQVACGPRHVALGPRRQRLLLAVLLCHPGEAIPTSRLIDALWGSSPPRSAADNIYLYVHRLRTALGAGLIGGGSGYTLRATPEDIDAHRFQELATRGEAAIAAGDLQRGRGELAEALALWHGRPFADLDEELVLQAEISRLEECRLRVLEQRVEVDLALGRHADLVAEVSSLAAEHPFRETFHAQLMLALYRSGRQADALAAYRHARAAMVDQLGLDPGPRLQDLQRAILRADPVLEVPTGPPGWGSMTPLATGSAGSGSAEPRTGQIWSRRARGSPIFGRQNELGRLAEMIASDPVVTLVGPPGVGKSRLAWELVGGEYAARFSDGAAVVELGNVSEPAHVLPAIATALGMHPDSVAGDMARLTARLDARRLLLILDNCEHLLDQCALIIDAIGMACPEVRVLATSRERLGLAHERIFEVGTLTLPATDSLRAVAESAAAGMLLSRAGDAVVVDPDNASHVATVCRLVDGLPLAIELAAARLRTVTLDQMIGRLSHQLDVLSRRSGISPRHRSLRAALDSSYGLLTDAERLLLARLSVFAGGFTLEAAETCAADEQLRGLVVLDTLCALVERSLVMVEDLPGYRRFRLLEVIRQYGAERLAELEQSEETHLRHAEYFCEFAAAAHRSRLAGWPAQVQVVDTEYANVRAAADWAIDHAPDVAVRITSAMQWYWMRRRTSDGRFVAQRTLAASDELPAQSRLQAVLALGLMEQYADPPSLAHLEEGLGLAEQGDDPGAALPFLITLGFGNWVLGNLSPALEYAYRAHRVAQAHGDDAAIARTCFLLGEMIGYAGTWPAARDVLLDGRARLTRLGDDRGVAEVDGMLGEVAYLHGEVDEAARLLQQAIDTGDQLADTTDWARTRTILGWIYLDRGDHETAQDLLQSAFDPRFDAESGWFSAGWLIGLGLALAAGIAHVHGDDRRTAILLGAVERAQQSPTAGPPGLTDPRCRRLTAATMASLGEQELHTLLRHGAQMPIPEAIAYAIDTPSLEIIEQSLIRD